MLLFFPRDVLDDILNLTESVSEGFPTYFYIVTYRSTSVARTLMLFTIAISNSFLSP